MSEQAPAKKRGAGKDADFMKAMREKAAIARQNNKVIRDAEKLKMKKEHEQKVKEAKDYLHPPPVQEQANNHDHEPDEPEETTKPAPRKRAPRAPRQVVEEDVPDYKQEYYRQKLEFLKVKQQEAPAAKEAAPQQPRAHPYDLARHDIQQHVNKEVMNNMWRQYFPDHASPYS